MTYLASLLLDVPGIDHGFETSGNLTLPEGTRYCTQAHGTLVIDADVVGRDERPVADAGDSTRTWTPIPRTLGQ
jgi:hypothetical protein